MGCAGAKEAPKEGNVDLKIRKEKLSECKVVFLGDAGVGKSSISQRLCNNIFNPNYEVTIGGAYLQRKMTLKNGVQLKLHLWDTGGEERFKAMAPLYYRDANAAILVYDVTEAKTYKSIDYWLKELDTRVKQDGLVLALVGNKCDVDDKDKKIALSTAKQYAEANKMIFYETSAKSGEGINELFKQVAEEIARIMNLK